ncbi:Sodium/hydrogen exchanger family-domain-containing protein [Phlebopus sp. FC_14]|nr:Sodium/hydrogen exchanger family-domain-containing protein [Phlebopus sp. FC_14]
MPDFSVFTRAVTGQGGLLTGQDPSAVNTSDPLRLWIIQVGIIVFMAQLLSLFLGRIKQPKVIAEVLGGILLGPTAFGRIPGFTEHIFPAASLPYLSLVANIGLCLFLFIIGLEIDASIISRNARLSIVVSLSGILLPFGIGCAISLPLYTHLISSTVHFPYFMLFVGVTFAITAFPVLCRILSALKLLDTTVGLIVLSAGVANDVISWSLLALCVAFVNASSGLTALYTFLVCVAFTLVLLFPVKRVLLWLARRTGSTAGEGPTMGYMTVVMLVLWASAFFTDIVGVNAIFGAFLAGVIVPREGGLAIALTEKLEDMVTILFLPLYFTISGLNTNLGLLNDGTTWAFMFAVAALDFTGKFTSCTLASRYLGFTWREASTVGSLMTCKGLVELIVLNVGLAAGILTQRVFSMFVLEALILTFLTTPVVNLLYPPSRRTHIDVHKPSSSPSPSSSSSAGDDKKRETGEDDRSSVLGRRHNEEQGLTRHSRFTVVLDKFEHMPSIMALAQLVVPPPPSSFCCCCSGDDDSLDHSAALTKHRKKPDTTTRTTSMDALRLVELTERTSAVMKSSIVDTLTRTDPLLCVFKMFFVDQQRRNDNSNHSEGGQGPGGGGGVQVSTTLQIVPQEDFAYHVAERARACGSQLVLLPWTPPPLPLQPLQGWLGGAAVEGVEGVVKTDAGAFGGFFFNAASAPKPDVAASTLHSHFVRSVFMESKTDVAVYVDAGAGTGTGVGAMNGHGHGHGHGWRQHLFLPFFGGADDRLALEFVMRVCEGDKRVSAEVVRVRKGPVLSEEGHEEDEGEKAKVVEMPERAVLAGRDGATATQAQTLGYPDTVYAPQTAASRLESDAADDILWARYARCESVSQSRTQAQTKARTRTQSQSQSQCHPDSSCPPTPAPLCTARIRFDELVTPAPLHALAARAFRLRETTHRRVVVVVGRSRRFSAGPGDDDHVEELKTMMLEEAAAAVGILGGSSSSSSTAVMEGYERGRGVWEVVRKTVGEVGAAFVVAGSGGKGACPMVVLQAGGVGDGV